MRQIEKNVIQSFNLAKTDIAELQTKMQGMSATQERILELIDKLNAHETMLYERLREISQRGAMKVEKPTPQLSPIDQLKVITKQVPEKKVVAKKKTSFVATKQGKNFHTTNCPFAQNIKPKNKVKFVSKTKALNQGFKPCNCIKK